MPARSLRSKLLAPQLHPDSIVRHRLVDRLTTSAAPIWLLSAPAGYGKTTLVAQALEDAATTAWVSVDRADNDPVRFWTHVSSALMGDGPELDELTDRMDPDHLDATIDALLAFVEDRTDPITLVLDDLHEINNTDITDTLGRIVSRPPAELRIVITARADPALPIGRLRTQGQLTELRAQDLAFTPDEAAAVFAGLDANTVAAIVDHTEGWATGLRMLAVSTTDASDAQAALDTLDDVNRDLGDFLAAEALGSLPPELQQFLIETSILDELCPQVCDAVVGRPGSLATLRSLARSQVFTDLVDPADNTYRYHRLFRDFLRQRADELNPERLVQLHTAAAAWYEVADDPTATIRHAAAAGDDGLLLATIKANYGTYAQAGLLTTVDRWLEIYGLDRCRRDPELRLAAAWVALNVRRYDEIEGWLEVPSHETADPAYRAQAHTIRSHRARHAGDLDTAITEAERAVEIADAPHADPDLDWSFVYAVLDTAGQLRGDFETGRSCAVVNLGRAHANDSAIASGYASLAMAAVEDPDQLDEAEGFADQALAFASTPVLERFHQPMAALLVKSRVALARGRVGDAADLAERADAIAETAVEPLYLALIQSQLARVEHARGHSDQARTHLRAAEAAVGDDPPEHIAGVMKRAGNDIRFARTEGGAPVELSQRERAVLQLLPHGLTRKQLGEQLFVSENTIKTYLTSLRHKLGVNGRSADIVQRARELGLLEVAEPAGSADT